MRTKLMLGAAIAAALSLGAASAHATILVSNIGVLDNTVVGISAPGLAENAFASPQVLTVQGNTNPSFLFFCLDIYGVDQVGTQTPPQAFNDGLLTSDYNGHALSSDQLGHTKDLLQQAGALYASNDFLGLEAMQLAFWEFDDGATINFLGNTALQNRTLSFVNDPGRVAGPVVSFDAAITTTQSGVVVPIGGVPEPSAWALMILGFGGAGAMLRRRRCAPALA